MLLLVVDDDADIVEFLSSFLELNRHTVLKAYQARQGLEIFRTQKPDAVFLDISLPDQNGLAVLKEMKRLDSETPVIMVTGFKEAENVVTAFREGALDCLLKPFNYDYLKDEILPKIPHRKRQK